MAIDQRARSGAGDGRKDLLGLGIRKVFCMLELRTSYELVLPLLGAEMALAGPLRHGLLAEEAV